MVFGGTLDEENAAIIEKGERCSRLPFCRFAELPVLAGNRARRGLHVGRWAFCPLSFETTVGGSAALITSISAAMMR